MTAVNWETLLGEQVEQLACTLILQAEPDGNRVTPSRGDGGIDFRIRAADGSGAWDVYQVKRYATRPLTAKRKKDIEKSFETFMQQSRPTMPIASWTLVLPLDPTKENLRWFEQVTNEADFPVRWLGRSQLDALAADKPRLVDYFQGDGAARIEELLTKALDAGRAVARDVKTDLLGAAGDRMAALAPLLDEIDPYYRYEIEIRHGKIEPGWLPSQADANAFATFEQIDDGHYRVVRIIPKTAYSTIVRPIRQTIAFDASDPEVRERLEAFQRYGMPFDPIPATTTNSVGPPGTTVEDGAPGLVSFWPLTDGDWPDIELRVVDEARTVIVRLPLLRPAISFGPSENQGLRIVATDRSDTVEIDARLSSPDSRDSLQMSLRPLTDKPVRRVRPATDFLEALVAHQRLELALEGGIAFGAAWSLEGLDVGNHPDWASFLRDLEVIQAHTAVVVLVPGEVDESLARRVARAAALLRGQSFELGRSSVGLEINEEYEHPEGSHAVRFHRPMVVDLPNQSLELNVLELAYCRAAHFEDGSDGPTVVFDEPATVQAVSPAVLQPDGGT